MQPHREFARGIPARRRLRRSRAVASGNASAISSAALACDSACGSIGKSAAIRISDPQASAGRFAAIAARACCRASASVPFPREQGLQDGLGFGARSGVLRCEPPAGSQATRLLEERVSRFEAAELGVESGDGVPFLSSRRIASRRSRL